ncbi:uncharacterized protein [Polyergus mexicanus]|uniref:uncharacterized protein n=1 Tax=Polyergus mexicanus TaxID=615972 RepID=UPI0038B4331A
MNSKLDDIDVPGQGKSESPGLGGSRVMVPDPPPSSSYAGPYEAVINDFLAADQEPMKSNGGSASNTLTAEGWNPEEEFIEILKEITVFEDNLPLNCRKKVRLVVEGITDYTRELCVKMAKLERARRYLWAKVDNQRDQIQMLQSELVNRHLELDTLRSLLFDQGFYDDEQQEKCRTHATGSPGVIRGEDMVVGKLDFDLSFAIDSAPVRSKEEHTAGQDTLIDEINRIRESIDLTQEKIIEKSVDLLELDVAAETALSSLVPLEDLRGDQETWNRAGRARRCGDTSRPRGRLPRLKNQTKTTRMKMEKESKINLPPQGSRSPSDRRLGSTVPGTYSSSSSLGPSQLLTTGSENLIATAEGMDGDERDPLELAFVDCLTSPTRDQMAGGSLMTREEAVTPATGNLAISGGKPKRKAKASPEAVTPSGDERDSVSGGTSSIALRKRRAAKKKPLADVTSSGSCMSTESERSIDQSSKGSSRKVPRGSLKARNKAEASILISSEEEKEGLDFAPMDLRAMSAVNAGAMGLDCLVSVERMRSKSKNLQGGISGRMRKEIERAKEVINTLIFKAEATGDPTFLKMKNKELLAEMDRMKLEEVLRKREMDEMKGQFNELRNEIAELKRRLEEAEDRRDEAEEDNKKARSRQRFAEYEARRAIQELRGEKDVEELPATDLPFSGSGQVSSPVTGSQEPGGGAFGLLLSAADAVEPEKKKKDWFTDTPIRGQRRDLTGVRAGLRKNRAEDSKTRNEAQKEKEKEKPLPQRTPRVKPRIISNVQLVPSRITQRSTGEEARTGRSPERDDEGRYGNWKEVSKRERGREPRGNKEQSYPSLSRPKDVVDSKRGQAGVTNKRGVFSTRRPPTTAAVMITKYGDDSSYAGVLKKAREAVSLTELKIDQTRIRKAANGGTIIEVMGPENSARANALAEKLRQVFQDQAKVARPVMKGEIRLVGLDDSISAEEVAYVIARDGGCSREEVKVGVIRPMNNGLFTVWAQCPLSAAINVSSNKRVRIGWTLARVDLLESRPVQCFRCWKFGHVRFACTAEEDFSKLCFRCGGTGHAARGCNKPPSCKICQAEGKDPNHRIGSGFCAAARNPDRVAGWKLMNMKVLQSNVNRSQPSLDLLLHQAREYGAGLLLISELNRTSNNDNWFISPEGNAAVFVDPQRIKFRCSLAGVGTNFVAISCGPYFVVSVYVPPSLRLREFNSVLDEISVVLSSRSNKIIIAGDFNAKANLWGASANDGRGLLLTRWAAERDLRIANTGDSPTCVRPQGSSIVDLTWVSPDLFPSIGDWCVRDELESLSDHLYISFSVGTSRPNTLVNKTILRKWNIKRFDRDLFMAVLTWRGLGPGDEGSSSISRMTKWLDHIIVEALDVAAIRIGPRSPKSQAYWWQDSVAVIRRRCLRARRSWQRAKRRRSCAQEEVVALGAIYKKLRKDLRTEISRLKSAAWQELLESIDGDPWGLPYRIVLSKLRTAAPGLTETLDPDTLERLLDSLFPGNELPDPIRNWPDFIWSADWNITSAEVFNAIKKSSTSSKKTPGPDGIRLAIWKCATDEILGWVEHLFNICLIKGEFPEEWKRANLALIPKAGGITNIEVGLPKVRPICLLNEIGKAFERILVARMVQWQADHDESGLSEGQFGFRKGRSTNEALLLLKNIVSTSVEEGRYAIAVSLDIRNAFNSIPWRVIRRALRRKGFPVYIQRIIDSYLSNRTIQYIGADGKQHTRKVEAGVPQGSVLGPLLWNIAFDGVLNLAEDEPDCDILCYADDTLIIVNGSNLRNVSLKASVFITRVTNFINGLGLQVAKDKTEAILFRGRGAQDLPDSIMIGDVLVQFSESIKYLGIYIDVRWTFSQHFKYVVEKTGRVIRALNRLMPNLRGPDEKRRRLYANVVFSVILYGAPLWGDALSRSKLLPALISLERSVAQRVISAYRTVSTNASLLLARLPPVHLLARARKRIYERTRESKMSGNFTRDIGNLIRDEEQALLVNDWRTQLERPNTPGEFTKLVIIPRMESWLDRNYGGMAFHVTQILTGHGCFAKYLHRIGRREDTCDFCGEVDDVHHTLRDCPAWDPERIRFKRSLGLDRDFSLGDVLESVLGCPEVNWVVFSTFVEKIMREKEEEERRRERAGNVQFLPENEDSDW